MSSIESRHDIPMIQIHDSAPVSARKLNMRSGPLRITRLNAKDMSTNCINISPPLEFGKSEQVRTEVEKRKITYIGQRP